MRKLPPIPFENPMSRTQTVVGIVYLVIHVLVMPFVLPPLMMALGVTDELMINAVYYLIGLVLVLTVFLSYLRRCFDNLLDRLGFCILSFFMALGLDYILSLGVGMLVMGLTEGVDNPNDGAIMELAAQSGGLMRALGIFLIPIVEEVLFRGVVFGGLRKKSRALAYVVSIALFSVYHVWQYVLVSGDWTLLIYVLQYLPVSFVLAWLYERTNSLWTSIGFHMMINAMSFYVEELVAEMM